MKNKKSMLILVLLIMTTVIYAVNKTENINLAEQNTEVKTNIEEPTQNEKVETSKISIKQDNLITENKYSVILNSLKKVSFIQYADKKTGLSFLYPNIFKSSPKEGSFDEVYSIDTFKDTYNTPVLAIKNEELTIFNISWDSGPQKGRKIYYDKEQKELIECDNENCSPLTDRESAIKIDNGYSLSCLFCYDEASNMSYTFIIPEKNIISTVTFDLSFYPVPTSEEENEAIIKEINDKLNEFRKEFTNSISIKK